MKSLRIRCQLYLYNINLEKSATSKSLKLTVFNSFTTVIYLLLSLPLDMSISIDLYKWHKIKVFIIGFSLIIHFIYVYLIFCKHIASTKLFLNFPITCLVRSYSFYIFIFFQKPNVVFNSG